MPWLPVRRRKWCVCPALILLSLVIGCVKTLPSSLQVLGRMDCRDVRAGTVNWRSVREPPITQRLPDRPSAYGSEAVRQPLLCASFRGSKLDAARGLGLRAD